MRGFTTYALIVFSCLTQILIAQDSVKFEDSKLNLSLTQKDIILTSLLPNGAVTLTPVFEDYISSWNLDESNSKRALSLISSAVDFKSHKAEQFKLDIPNQAEIGTVCFNESDSSVAFSAFSGGKSSIYYSKKGSKPELILKGSLTIHYHHPFLSTDGTQLFYASNEGNLKDNYDLFYLNLIGDKWGEPVKLGSEINTPENELFPTWYDDTLYFSVKENKNDLNLYSSAKRDQYKTKSKLGTPFNSKLDDFLLHKKNNSVYYVSSKRSNQSDQPYLIQKVQAEIKEKMMITGFLACNGNRISNIPISLTNFLGIQIDENITDSYGNFILRADKKVKKYKIKLEKDDPRIKDCAVLYITDEKGNVIQKITTNEEGEFVFELLSPDDIESLNLMSLEDESLLQIELNGQIYEKEPGDIGDGEPVYIFTDQGEMSAVTFTSEEGKFKFTDLSPAAEYNLKFSDSRENLKARIIKDFEVIPLKISNNEAVYKRINKTNAVELLDDEGRSITVEKDEFFSLQNILYEFDSERLTPNAKSELQRLANFIFNNDNINIELTSHTDSRGPEDYNLNLSQKRALAAIAYLETLGISAERLNGYGVGEKDLLNGCVDGINCTEEQHAMNRRTEIRIIVQD